MKKEILEKIKEIGQGFFRKAKGSHDWSHSLRVWKLSLKIAKKEGGDVEVLTMASLLHDIGREKELKTKGRICHAKESARLAKKILLSLGVPREKIKKVCVCIENHRFRKKRKCLSLEEKILFDADKLDAIGAVGIGRAFLFSGEIGAKLYNDGIKEKHLIKKTREYSNDDTAFREYLVKLKKIKNKMLTKTGRRMAIERTIFMEKFFRRFKKEIRAIV